MLSLSAKKVDAHVQASTLMHALHPGSVNEQWSSGVSVHSAVAPGVGHKAAYFPMFHSPASVDNRAVRMGRVIMFFITTLCAVFIQRGVVAVVVSRPLVLVVLIVFRPFLEI